MMHLKEIKELIEIFDTSNLTKLQIKQDIFEIKLDKTTPSTPVLSPSLPTNIPTQTIPKADAPVIEKSSAHDGDGGDFITSLIVGTFYHCPKPGAAPFVKVGDIIKKGQVIGIIEAMKMMNEIEAEYDCKILSIETNDAQPVEYGSKLMKVEKI